MARGTRLLLTCPLQDANSPALDVRVLEATLYDPAGLRMMDVGPKRGTHSMDLIAPTCLLRRRSPSKLEPRRSATPADERVDAREVRPEQAGRAALVIRAVADAKDAEQLRRPAEVRVAQADRVELLLAVARCVQADDHEQLEQRVVER